MKRNRNRNVLSQRGAYLKKSIAGTRCRAKFVGLLYLVGIIALAAVAALMPLFDLTKQTLAPIGVFAFWQQFLPANLANMTTAEGMIKLINAALYGLMLVGVVINALRGLGKLAWLFKKKASKTYGFNRNVYAMEDLGNIFSGSFAVIIVTYFLMAVVSGQLYPNMMALIVVFGGAAAHLVLGFIGGKVKYYDIIDGEIEVQERTVRRFPALFRNVLQLGAVFAMLYFFMLVSTIHTVIGPLMEVGGIQNYVLGQPMAYLSIVCQVLTLIFVLPLVKHATATTEYNLDGAYGPGMKTFRVFSFFTALAAAGTFACRYLLGEIVFSVNNGTTSFVVAQLFDKGSIIVAGVAFVMFIVELIMRNAPGYKKEKKAKKENEDEFAPDYKTLVSNPFVSVEYGAGPNLKPVPNAASPYVNIPLSINVDTREGAGSAAMPFPVPYPLMGACGAAKKEEEPALPPPPVTIPTQPVVEENEPEEEEEEEEVVEETFEVNCPVCGKALRIKEGPTHYRCPSCGKVFQTRKVMKEVQK